MSHIRVTCLLCDQAVEVHARRVVLHLLGTRADADNRYAFQCPECEAYVVRPASPQVVDALLGTDVELVTGSTPPWETMPRPGLVLVEAAPAAPALARPDAPPLTEADALLLRLALSDDAIVEAWLSGD